MILLSLRVTGRRDAASCKGAVTPTILTNVESTYKNKFLPCRTTDARRRGGRELGNRSRCPRFLVQNFPCAASRLGLGKKRVLSLDVCMLAPC